MTEEASRLKCPICGTLNDPTRTECMLCRTQLARQDSGKVKVEAPKKGGEVFNVIDIEDPLTRKNLEELTLIPGITKIKALYLYKSGITSMEEFLEKAFKGERFSKNFSRTLANKLLVSSIRGGKTSPETAKILCPSCNAENMPDVQKCKVCGFDMEKDMDGIDMADMSSKLSGSVDEVLGELVQNEDFSALPEEMKATVAMILDGEEIDFDARMPENIESLGLKKEDLDEVAGRAQELHKSAPEEKKPEPEKPKESPKPDIQKPIPKAEEMPGQEPEKPAESPKPAKQKAVPKAEEKPKPAPKKAAEAPKPEIPAKAAPAPQPAAQTAVAAEKMAAQKEKIRNTLKTKLDEWRKAGYDVSGLEDFLDNVEVFKAKAKVVLKMGKVIKEQYAKQLEAWREKGFDVSELEPLLATDIDAFKEKAADILKRQKK
jgi:hypothetical protein